DVVAAVGEPRVGPVGARGHSLGVHLLEREGLNLAVSTVEELQRPADGAEHGGSGADVLDADADVTVVGGPLREAAEDGRVELRELLPGEGVGVDVALQPTAEAVTR